MGRGIKPPANKTTSLSGQDTKEQHAGFWKYTITPLLKQFESIVESQFFGRLGISECVD
jgi:hypothetical protein